MNPALLAAIIDAVDLLGVAASGILGGLAARSARLDLVGVLTLGFVSGLGGGMIRDALLQTGTVAALRNPAYLPVAFAGSLVAWFLGFDHRWSNRTLLVIDAIAVGAWSAVGVQKGFFAGLEVIQCLFLGITTAVAGGALRDLLLGRRPSVLGGNTLYATAAFVASLAAYVLTAMGQPLWASVAGIVLGASIAILARRYRWFLPTEPPQFTQVWRLPRRHQSKVAARPARPRTHSGHDLDLAERGHDLDLSERADPASDH